MKKSFLISLALLCVAYVSSAQELTNEYFCGNTDLYNYYKGCLSIANAEVLPKSQSSMQYEDAIGFLAPVYENKKYVNRYRVESLVRVDGEALIPVEGRLQFTYEYARKMYDDVLIKEKSIFREEEFTLLGQGAGEAVKCRVMTFAMKANSTVKFKDIMVGTSIVVVMCEPNAQVALSVVSDKTLQGTPFEKGMVSYCKWESAEEQDFVYCIENKSDKEISVVLMAN